MQFAKLIPVSFMAIIVRLSPIAYGAMIEVQLPYEDAEWSQVLGPDSQPATMHPKTPSGSAGQALAVNYVQLAIFLLNEHIGFLQHKAAAQPLKTLSVCALTVIPAWTMLRIAATETIRAVLLVREMRKLE